MMYLKQKQLSKIIWKISINKNSNILKINALFLTFFKGLTTSFYEWLRHREGELFHAYYTDSIRDVMDSQQINKSTFSICQLNRIEWLGIESK